MPLNIKFFLFGFKVCPTCGSFNILDTFLCYRCEENLKRLQGPYTQLIDGYKTRFLYDWQPQSRHLIGKFIRVLKGKYQKRGWSENARHFVHNHGKELFLKHTKIVWVPVPNYKKEKDHSFLWAQALQEHYGGSLLSPGLIKINKMKQKDRTKRQRFQRLTEFVSLSKLQNPEQVKFIIVDDIITTGLTFRSIYQALGMPPDLEIWVLAQKAKAITR